MKQLLLAFVLTVLIAGIILFWLRVPFVVVAPVSALALLFSIGTLVITARVIEKKWPWQSQEEK